MPETDLPEANKSNSSTSSANSTSSSLEHVPSNLSISSLSLSNNVDVDEVNNIQADESQIRYEPIVLPKETTLDELLRNAACTNNLDTLTEVHLKVSFNMLGLQRLNIFLPNLLVLNLDGSLLKSLRDLGSNLSVKHLNVSRCGLTSFDGTNGLATVQHLVADGNSISNLQPLCNLNNLRILSIRGNKINNLGAVSFLVLCSGLRELDLIGNSVTQHNNYRDYVKKNIPELGLLDGMGFGEESSQLLSGVSETLSSSDYSASVLTTSSSDDAKSFSIETNNDIEGIDRDIRPASCGDIRQICIKKTIGRPSTADSIGERERSLITGEPIFGNIVSAVRRQRKKNAWAVNSETQSLSSSSSNSSRVNSAKKFPKTLPQHHVELELGVIGVGSSSNSFNQNNNDELSLRNSNGDQIQDDEVKVLLAAAQKWRMNAQKNVSDKK